jgi:hypothetical protein
MVYTEYFANGTAPAVYCDLHQTRSIMTKIAGLFGGNVDRPASPSVDTTALSTAPPPAVGPDAQMDAAPDPPKRKRGFWSKLFGRGKDDDGKRDQPAKKKGGE